MFVFCLLILLVEPYICFVYRSGFIFICIYKPNVPIFVEDGDVKMEEAKDGEDTSKIDGDGEIKEGETLAKEVVSTDVDMVCY